MTSMPLTSSSGGAAGAGAGVATWIMAGLRKCSGTAAGLDVLVLRVLRRVLRDQGVEVRLARLVPVGLHHPLASVPLRDAGPVGAHVVAAGGLDRPHDLAEAQLLEPLGREVEVLEAPAHLLGRQGLALAELLLRGADRLHL